MKQPMLRIFWLLALAAGWIATPAWSEEEPPCTGADLQVAIRAAAHAGLMLDQAIRAIDHPSSADLVRLKVWFGDLDPSGAKRVRRVLVNARAFASGASYRCAVNTDMRIGDTFAYVRPDQSFAIVLGAFFLNGRDTGYDSRSGTMIHEMTHFLLAGATRDTTYGAEGARQLAARDSASAQMNADNYEYFVEATAFDLK